MLPDNLFFSSISELDLHRFLDTSLELSLFLRLRHRSPDLLLRSCTCASGLKRLYAPVVGAKRIQSFDPRDGKKTTAC